MTRNAVQPEFDPELVEDGPDVDGDVDPEQLTG